MAWSVVLALLAGGVADAPLALPACPIDRAIYGLRGAAGYRVGFARYPHPVGVASDLAFFLKTPKRTYWFSFAVSQGYATIALVPDVDPHGAEDAPKPQPDPDSPPPTVRFAAFDATLAELDHPPSTTDLPPARLHLADLGIKLWYEPVGLASGDQAAEQESLPPGLWEPAGCDARPH